MRAGPGKVDQWDLLTRARALDSSMSVISVDQADPSVSGTEVPADAPTGVGHSLVADPFGKTIARLVSGEEVTVVEVDPHAAQEAARAIPILQNVKLAY